MFFFVGEPDANGCSCTEVAAQPENYGLSIWNRKKTLFVSSRALSIRLNRLLLSKLMGTSVRSSGTILWQAPPLLRMLLWASEFVLKALVFFLNVPPFFPKGPPIQMTSFPATGKKIPMIKLYLMINKVLLHLLLSIGPQMSKSLWTTTANIVL